MRTASKPLRVHPHYRTTGVFALVFLTLTSATAARAQDDGRFYVGIALGGISTVSLVMEQEWDWGSFELMLGSLTFRDLSISLVHKQRIGGGPVYGVVGAGLWSVVAFPPEGRTGFALAARVPVGLEWDPRDDQRFNMEVGFLRALYIRRPDPEDDLPPSNRIVPLPGFSYRFAPGGD